MEMCRHHPRNHQIRIDRDGKKGTYCRLCKKFVLKFKEK